MTDNATQAAEQVSERKKSRFEEVTGAAPVAQDDGDFDGGFTPRVVYTVDATPDLSKMQVPRLRLAQGLTSEVQDRKAQIGQYVLTNFPAEDEVVLVPLAAQSIRVYQPDPKGRPQCFAPTGTHGIGNPGIVCADCALSKWTRDPNDPKRGIKPPCTEGVAMRAYSTTHGSVVDMQFMGRTISKGQFVQQQGLARGMGQFAIKLTSGRVENQRGSWYEPVLEVAPVPEEHAEMAAKWHRAMIESMTTTEQAEKQLALEAGS